VGARIAPGRGRTSTPDVITLRRNSWDDPQCQKGGFYVVDIRDPATPKPGPFVPARRPSARPGPPSTIAQRFDGWGCAHLNDARTTSEELDAYAIEEALDPRYATRSTSPAARRRYRVVNRAITSLR